MPRRKVSVYLLLCAFFIVTACNHDEISQPSTKPLQVDQPKQSEIDQVISHFLSKHEPVPFQLWTAVDGKTVASMTGITEANGWELEGTHEDQSFIRLSGRQNKVEWETKKASGTLENTTFGLYSPYEHLKQLSHSYRELQWAPGNRHSSDWTAVQMSLTDEKVEQAIITALGEQFASPSIAQNIAQKMEVRYTLWYNKQSYDLNQIKIDLYKKGDNTHQLIQSLIYVFRESSE